MPNRLPSTSMGGWVLLPWCSPLWGAGGRGCLVNTLFINAFFCFFHAFLLPFLVFFSTFVEALNLICYVGISHSEGGEIGKCHAGLFVRERATPLPNTRAPRQGTTVGYVVGRNSAAQSSWLHRNTNGELFSVSHLLAEVLTPCLLQIYGGAAATRGRCYGVLSCSDALR